MVATMKDVARLAHVSPSTVSRVLAGHPAISAETAARVRQAMAELNYQPNQIARSLSRQATHTISLIMPDPLTYPLLNAFFVQAIRGVMTYARKRGYYLLLTYPENNDTEAIVKDLIGSRRVDGVILSSVSRHDPALDFLVAQKHPHVMIGRPYREQDTLWVDNDNRGIVYEVTSRLISQGCQTIAYLGGADEFRVTLDRLQGYLDALRDHGIPSNPTLIYRKQFTETIAAEVTHEILATCLPDAVIATDDALALGVEKALHETHHQNEVAVVGFNNTLVAQYVHPSLSSVEVNPEQLGYYAAKLLISRLEGVDPGVSHYLIDAQFIERESSRPKSRRKK
jgi:DNA-binding LacI/PurR family transcriptional regulator